MKKLITFVVFITISLNITSQKRTDKSYYFRNIYTKVIEGKKHYIFCSILLDTNFKSITNNETTIGDREVIWAENSKTFPPGSFIQNRRYATYKKVEGEPFLLKREKEFYYGKSVTQRKQTGIYSTWNNNTTFLFGECRWIDFSNFKEKQTIKISVHKEKWIEVPLTAVFDNNTKKVIKTNSKYAFPTYSFQDLEWIKQQEGILENEIAIKLNKIKQNKTKEKKATKYTHNGILFPNDENAQWLYTMLDKRESRKEILKEFKKRINKKCKVDKGDFKSIKRIKAKDKNDASKEYEIDFWNNKLMVVNAKTAPPSTSNDKVFFKYRKKYTTRYIYIPKNYIVINEFIGGNTVTYIYTSKEDVEKAKKILKDEKARIKKEKREEIIAKQKAKEKREKELAIKEILEKTKNYPYSLQNVNIDFTKKQALKSTRKYILYDNFICINNYSSSNNLDGKVNGFFIDKDTYADFLSNQLDHIDEYNYTFKNGKIKSIKGQIVTNELKNVKKVYYENDKLSHLTLKNFGARLNIVHHQKEKLGNNMKKVTFNPSWHNKDWKGSANLTTDGRLRNITLVSTKTTKVYNKTVQPNTKIVFNGFFKGKNIHIRSKDNIELSGDNITITNPDLSYIYGNYKVVEKYKTIPTGTHTIRDASGNLKKDYFSYIDGIACIDDQKTTNPYNFFKLSMSSNVKKRMNDRISSNKQFSFNVLEDLKRKRNNKAANAIFTRKNSGTQVTCPVCKGMKRFTTTKKVKDCKLIADNDAVFIRTKKVCKYIDKVVDVRRCSRCKGTGIVNSN